MKCMTAPPRASRSSVENSALPHARMARFRVARGRRGTRGGGVRGPRETGKDDADHQPADPQSAGGATGPQEGSGAPAIPAETRSVYPRLYDHAEEAELGVAQGRQGAPDQ